MDTQTLQTYQASAAEFAGTYRRMMSSRLYESIKTFFRPAGATADIGCGSGRDANGFKTTGYDASAEMLLHAQSQFPMGNFLPASLPDLADIPAASVDNVLCSATLMHLRREDMITGALALSRIMRPEGRLILTYRGSRAPTEREADGRLFTPIPAGKLTLLLESAGFKVVLSERRQDEDRPDILWTVILAEKGPLDRSSGLERVQSILVQDRMTATYKFALIRAFCQISRTQPHVVRWGLDCVYVPIWDVAIRWLAFYWPLLTTPTFIAQTWGEAPGSSKRIAFRADIHGVAAENGSGGLWSVLRDIQLDHRKHFNCLRKIARTIRLGPVTYAGGGQNPAFQYADNAAGMTPFETSSPFGWIRVPESIWLDISRFDTWIEDSIIMRWAALSAEMNPGESMAKFIPYLVSSPGDQRDTSAIRDILLNYAEPIHCVWTGKLIDNDLHVDHAIPYSVWNNNDYWNMLPCHYKVNLDKKDSLPAQSLITERADIIVDYWRIYKQHFPTTFDQQISAALGCHPDADNWEKVALSGFKETIQRISATRGLRSWEP
jgi:SAM-dependent methyltransferase